MRKRLLWVLPLHEIREVLVCAECKQSFSLLTYHLDFTPQGVVLSHHCPSLNGLVVEVVE